jgi:hypothetical protein
LKVDRIASAELIKHLIEITPRPWAEYDKQGKPISQNRLARLLKPVGISPGKVGPSSARLNGYEHEWFKEAFGRYLAPVGGFKPDIRTQCDEQGTSDISKVDTPENECPLWNCEKSNNDGVMSGCPVSEGGLGAICAQCGLPGGDEIAIGGLPGLVTLHSDCMGDFINSKTSTPPPVAAFRVIEPTPKGTTCIACHGSTGEVLKIRSAEPGSKAETLHEACAMEWFDMRIRP